ncbi:hypothetical protein CWI75_16275 [Kineobactrum sediminis]|uniref:Uncharacterized protein n=1 Tax=Kineobactrum sediminis TaxID=1905677 RepID=A0A2N5XZ21_9GAMM|nr:hypothetical protein [Kineobactrum sediminis]PLW81386.1 hypothetical protein CWI75_16275 [Kineobactrum sediminis]
MENEVDTRSYRLISGIFHPDEATQLLMTLIEDKISFHQRKDWSRRERFGETDTEGVKRIGELRQTKADLAAVIKEAAAAGMKLTINGNIEITLTPE